MSRTVRRVVEAVALPIVAVALWQLATVWADSPFFPPPLEIFEAAQEEWLSGPASRLFLSDAVFDDVVPSLLRLLGGWSIAAAVGIGLGLLLGLRPALSDYTAPVVEFVRSVPPPATLPIFVILFGADAQMRVLFIAFGVVWFVLINTISGVQSVEPTQLDTGRAFRVGPLRRALRIVLPAAMPKIFAGLRISLAGALILMVISELVVATDGIGFQILQAQRSFAILDMWAGIVLLAVFGYLLNTALHLAENRILSWHRQSRHQEI